MYFTAYPRRAFAYSWRKPLGTVNMTVGYEGFREALGCGSEPVWRGAEPMKSPQRIRHPQLHVALMRRVRDFLTTLLPKRSGFSHAPFPLSFPSLEVIFSSKWQSNVDSGAKYSISLQFWQLPVLMWLVSDVDWNWTGLIVVIKCHLKCVILHNCSSPQRYWRKASFLFRLFI